MRRVVEIALGWAAFVLIGVAAVLAIIGRGDWWLLALSSLLAYAIALALRRRRRGRIDVFDDL